MKRLRLQRWSTREIFSGAKSGPTRPSFQQWIRTQTTPSTTRLFGTATETSEDLHLRTSKSRNSPPTPYTKTKTQSAKLSALHARLSLPAQFPLETLAQTLVDSTWERSAQRNNKALAVLGRDLLGQYTSEYIICQYPRLPLAVVYAAMYAYVGPKALAAMTREWGVEYAVAPGEEVDPGLLQFRRVPPESQEPQQSPQVVATSIAEPGFDKLTLSRRTIHSDEFGDLKIDAKTRETRGVIEAENACTNFVRALVGAIYLHAGRVAVKQFYKTNFMSRQLNMAQLFQFQNPTRDLSRLCAREGFQSPVARMESETGRKSRTPVFVVGIYSGNDKLGEGVGASLDEARVRAAVASLKGWYLYSPLDFRLPSDMEEPDAKPWTPVLVDFGDITN